MKKTTSSKSIKKNVKVAKAAKRVKPKAAKIIDNKDNKDNKIETAYVKQDICEDVIVAYTIKEDIIEAENMQYDKIELADTGSASFEAVETGSIEGYNEEYKQDSYNNDSVYTAHTSIDYKPYAHTTCGNNTKDNVLLYICLAIALACMLCISAYV